MTWEQYAIELAEVAKLKSKDPWLQVGAVLLRHDNTIAGIGFNGFPTNMDEDWTNREKRRSYVIHAEQNAMRYAKPNECRLIATTTLPCNNCLKMIAGYGIEQVVYRYAYERDDSTLQIANDFGIELIKL
jgi:dCMP deaminase